MRGTDTREAAIFNYHSPEQQVSPDHPHHPARRATERRECHRLPRSPAPWLHPEPTSPETS